MRADRFQKAARLAEVAELENDRRGRGLSRRGQLEMQDWSFVVIMRQAIAEQKTGKLSEFAADLLRPWSQLSSEARNLGFSCGYGYLR